jgi:hypothetical protein
MVLPVDCQGEAFLVGCTSTSRLYPPRESWVCGDPGVCRAGCRLQHHGLTSHEVSMKSNYAEGAISLMRTPVGRAVARLDA